jgi:hypothetical protein
LKHERIRKWSKGTLDVRRLWTQGWILFKRVMEDLGTDLYSVNANGWSRRSRWSYSFSANDKIKPMVQLAVKLFHITISTIRDYWRLTEYIDNRITICMLLTPPKSELHSWEEKWDSKLSQSGWTGKMIYHHIHSPRWCVTSPSPIDCRRSSRSRHVTQSHYFPVINALDPASTRRHFR